MTVGYFKYGNIEAEMGREREADHGGFMLVFKGGVDS